MEAALSADNQTLIASTVAAADSWHSPWFNAWKQQMGAGEPVPATSAPRKDKFTSARFQWLPAEILVGEGHRIVFDSYVNNMHPERHAPLYAATARLLQQMLPLFERTLGAAARRTRRDVIPPDDSEEWWSPPGEGAFWDSLRASGEAAALLRGWREAGNGAHAAEDEGSQGDEGPKEDEGSDGAGGEAVCDYRKLQLWQWDQLDEMYRERRQWVGVKLPDEYQPPPPPLDIQLKNRTLQVVVKYAEIVLTPEKPEYPGGAWHVEGMRNEAILAACVAYLASDNITESRLHFRSMAADPFHNQNDDDGVRLMYGLEDNGPVNEALGSALCMPGRVLCWPNALQHCVAPFCLADTSRPGRRTIAAVFLVHPNFPVLSTRDVPPQQREWHDAASRLGSVMPEDLKERLDALREFPVSIDRAKELRRELMRERVEVVRATNREVFERAFVLAV